jgi:hypothetical protein
VKIKARMIVSLEGKLVIVTRQCYKPEEIEAAARRFQEALAKAGIEVEFLGPLKDSSPLQPDTK